MNQLSIQKSQGRLLIPEKRFFNIVFLITIFSLLFISVYVSRSNFTSEDEMYIIHDSWRILQGERLYRDLFQFYPPLTIFTYLPFLALFGKTFLAIDLARICLTLGLILTSFFYGQYLRISHWYSLLFSTFVVFLFNNYWAVFNPHWWGTIWQLLAIIILLNWSKIREKRRIIFLVLISTLALYNHTTRGAALIFATTIVLLISRQDFGSKTAWRYLTKTLIITLLLFLPVILWAGWPNFYQSVLWFPLNGYLELNIIFPWDAFKWLVVLLAVSLVILIGGKNIIEPKQQKVIFIITFWQLLAVIYRFDIVHLITTAIPLMILPLVILNRYRQYFSVKTISLVLVLYLLANLINFIRLNYLLKHPFILAGERKLVSKQQFEYIDNLLNSINKDCQNEKFVYFGPYIPSMYFYTNYQNPTRFSILYKRYSTKTHFEEALRDIKNKQVKCLVFFESHFSNKFWLESNLRDYAERVFLEKKKITDNATLYILPVTNQTND